MNYIKKGLLTLALTLSVAVNWAHAQDITTDTASKNNSKVELTPQLEKELLCLARNIYYEAGYESFEGKVAVAQVTINRSENGRFPSTICEVVKQRTVLERPRKVTSVKEITTGWGMFKKTEKISEVRTVIEKYTVCQFSWYCTEKGRKVQPPSTPGYQESLEIARKVLIEGFRLDHLREALYFHARYVKPNWGKVKVAQIGNHIFYRDHQ